MSDTCIYTQHWPESITVKLGYMPGYEREQRRYVYVGTCCLEETEHEHEVPIDLPGYAGGTYTEVTYDCDECGYENRDSNVRYCGGCGRKVIDERVGGHRL